MADVAAANLCPGCGNELKGAGRFCGECGCPTATRPTPRKASRKRLLGVLLLLVIGLAVAYAIQPLLFFRLLSAVGIVMMAFSCWMVFKTYRKPRKVAFFGLLLAIVSGLISFTISYEMSAAHDPGFRDRLNAEVMLPIVFAGWGFGVLWSFTQRLMREDGRIKSRGNAWYLIFWMGLFCATQLMMVVMRRPPELSIKALCFSTAVLMTHNSLLFVRALVATVRWRPEPPTVTGTG